MWPFGPLTEAVLLSSPLTAAASPRSAVRAAPRTAASCQGEPAQLQLDRHQVHRYILATAPEQSKEKHKRSRFASESLSVLIRALCDLFWGYPPVHCSPGTVLDGIRAPPAPDKQLQLGKTACRVFSLLQITPWPNPDPREDPKSRTPKLLWCRLWKLKVALPFWIRPGVWELGTPLSKGIGRQQKLASRKASYTASAKHQTRTVVFQGNTLPPLLHAAIVIKRKAVEVYTRGARLSWQPSSKRQTVSLRIQGQKVGT